MFVITVFCELSESKEVINMKKEWTKPILESLDVKMTMKFHDYWDLIMMMIVNQINQIY